MEYAFTDYDKRTYPHKRTYTRYAESVAIESKITADGYVELSFANGNRIFIVLKISDREAAAISSAVLAGRAKCTSRILVGEEKEES